VRHVARKRDGGTVKTRGRPFGSVNRNKNRIGDLQVINISREESERVVTTLDRQLRDEAGRIKLLPARAWLMLDPTELRVWCHHHAAYGIPTLELVAWLQKRIAGRKALEIGSGCNDLGYHLGIRQTDLGQQGDAAWQNHFSSIPQPPTRPRADVERISAAEAVAKYQPDVVIGSWITQLLKEGDDYGLPLGVDERPLINAVDTYIHIGHWRVHAKKRVLRLPHAELRPPGLLSRFVDDQGGNYIAIWEKGGK